MSHSANMEISERDHIRKQLLECTDELIRLSRSNENGLKLQEAKYGFLWNTSLADTEALEAAYDRMIEGEACYDMPIDSNAVFGRILVMAIASSNPAKAVEVFETLIRLYSSPDEGDFIKQEILVES